MKKFALVTVGVLFFVSLAAFMGRGKGIVVLEGYEHGAAFCGQEIEWTLHTSDATSWWDGDTNITYVVNKGHMLDPEVDDLMDLAEEHCKQFDETD